MVDDTYYITPHEAALAVVATAMKKSRLPFYILFINSIMGAFLFSAGGMLYIMCEAGGSGLMPGENIFVYILQGAVYAIGLFYVIVCGMELFNSNILFFSVGVMRGAVTLMDLFISWFVSFWVNLAATIFVVYVICYCSGVFKQEVYVTGSVAICKSKDSFSFVETMLKGIAGNFFVCLAVYLQIMVKPLHVKFLMIFLPIFTFVAMGFTHVVADMFLVPAGIFNDCGYGFGHYFWKIMLSGAIGNIIGGSFFGVVIPWFLHLYVIENDMKKLNLPAYEERDEQPMLNMDSRVVRVPTTMPTSSSDSDTSSIHEFKPDLESGLSRVATTRSTATGLSRIQTNASSIRSRNSKQLRSPKGVFPVVDMGEPLQKEKTIASAYQPSIVESNVPPNNLDELLEENDNSEEAQSSISNEDEEDEDNSNYSGVSAYSGNSKIVNMNNRNSIDDNGRYMENPYDPEEEKVSSKLMRVLSRTVSRAPSPDIEKGEGVTNDNDQDNGGILSKVLTRTGNKIEKELGAGLQESKKNKSKDTKTNNKRPSIINKQSSSSNKLFRQFTFGGGGNNSDEIQRRLSEARITRKAAGMSNDIAGIHVDTVDSNKHAMSKRKNQRRRSSSASSKNNKTVKINTPQDSKLGGKYASDRWKHFTYDYELDGERPVSFISERSRENPQSDISEESISCSDDPNGCTNNKNTVKEGSSKYNSGD